MRLPSQEDVLAIWHRYCTPVHVRAHMKQVNRVAVFLAMRLIAAREHVNLDLVDRAALLHDTIRVTEAPRLSFEHFRTQPTPHEIACWQKQRRRYPPSIPHHRINEEIFKEDYPEMAAVILHHGLPSMRDLHTMEEKIVNLADRYVQFDRIVSLQERLDDVHARYRGQFSYSLARDSAIVAASIALEKELWKKIGEDPRNLLSLLHHYESSQSSASSASSRVTAGTVAE